MRHFLIHFLVLTLIGSGFAYAADSHDEAETYAPSNAELLSQDNSNHDDNDEHHAHHGCHLSVHLIGLTNESGSLVPVVSRNSYNRLTKTYITHLSAPPARPPRS